MNSIEVISIGIMNILCFFIGARVGQKVINKEEVKIPDPIEMIRETKIKKENKIEQEIMKANLENIDMYDGSSIGQKDIPY